MPDRVHPEAKVDDRFGPFTVTKLIPRGHARRSDERVGWRCVCGRSGEAYVFNLRKVKPSCPHEDRWGMPTKVGERFPKDVRSDRPQWEAIEDGNGVVTVYRDKQVHAQMHRRVWDQLNEALRVRGQARRAGNG